MYVFKLYLNIYFNFMKIKYIFTSVIKVILTSLSHSLLYTLLPKPSGHLLKKIIISKFIYLNYVISNDDCYTSVQAYSIIL